MPRVKPHLNIIEDPSPKEVKDSLSRMIATIMKEHSLEEEEIFIEDSKEVFAKDRRRDLHPK